MVFSRCFKFCCIICTYFCTIIAITSASNILAINHITGTSHLQLFSAIIEELVSRGHNVTYLGIVPYTGHLESQVTQHPLKSKVISDRSSVLKMMRDATDPSKSLSVFATLLTYFKLHGKEPCTYLESDIVTTIMNSSLTFDVLILDAYASECFHSIAYMKKIPLILLSSSIVFPWHYITLGIDPSIGIEKSFMLQLPKDNLIQRALDFLRGNFLMLYRYWLFASATDNWLLKNYPNVKFPPFYELEKNISLLMVNNIPAMGYARSEGPTVVNIGGVHFRPPKKLPNELESFISESTEEGFIYFSLGSTFKTEFVSENLLNTFLEAFKQLPYPVIMKWNDNSTSMPSNVLSSSWQPQQDILGDPRVRVFVTQGGIFSIQEAAYHGVPVVVIPIILDQFTNAEHAEKIGHGIQLNIKTVTTAILVNAIQKVIKESSFKNTALQLSSAIRDTPNTPREMVTWWTEYVIRNGGTERLKTARQRLPWYQQQQLDVFILLSSITLLVVGIFYLVVSTTYRMIKRLVQRKEKLA